MSDDLFPLSASHRSMSVCLLTSNASRTRSVGRLSSTSAKHSKYCNAYSRPLEAIITYQMIYSRSLPAIEGCRYVYWRQMPAVLAPWGLISGHTQTNKNTSPVHPVPVITLYNEFLTVNLKWDRGLVVTHAALYAQGPGFDSPLGKLFFFFFFFFLRISYDTVLTIKIFDYDIDSESLTGEDRCVKKEVKRRIAHLFGQHYTHSGTFFPGFCEP